MSVNRGAVETKAAFEGEGLTQNQAAAEVGYDSGNFSKILREEDGKKPGRALANRIFARFGVQPTSWDEPVPANADEPQHPTGTG